FATSLREGELTVRSREREVRGRLTDLDLGSRLDGGPIRRRALTVEKDAADGEDDRRDDRVAQETPAPRFRPNSRGLPGLVAQRWPPPGTGVGTTSSPRTITCVRAIGPSSS